MSERFGKAIRIRGKSNATNKHKKPVYDIVKEVITHSDIVIEILDARFIEETRYPQLERKIIADGKILIRVLNKCDLVDVNKIRRNKELKELEPYIFFSLPKRKGIRELREAIKIYAQDLIGKKREGLFPEMRNKRDVKVGVIGYQNTGKSTILNLLVGRKVARTSPEAGFTKGMMKVRLNENIVIFDTPGIFPKKEDSNRDSQALVKHGMISVRTWDKIKNPDFVVHEFVQKFPGLFEKFYNIPANGDSEILIQELGKRKHILRQKGLVDIDRTARLIIRDWQDGKIRVS